MALQKLMFKSLTLACMLAFSIPAAFAQEPTENATTTAQEQVAEPESWFEIEEISGQIEAGDFVVGPGRSEIQLQPGQTYVQEVLVTNRLSDNREFILEVEDITGTTDGSRAVALTGDEVGPYSIRDLISFPQDRFELGLGERARIPVTISVPDDAEPGGYYGSVLVSTVSTEAETTPQGTVARSPVIARIGSLFFVTVDGETLREGETLGISTIEDRSFFQSGPIEFAVLFENSGTVHTNPYGELSITNMFGEEVGYVELEPWFVLPRSLRSREITWDREFLLGRYEVTARINRGYEDVIDEVTTSFWVLPYRVVGGAFVILFVVILLFRFITKNFEFKRKATD